MIHPNGFEIVPEKARRKRAKAGSTPKEVSPASSHYDCGDGQNERDTHRAVAVSAIVSKADYDWALAEIEQYFEHEPAPGSNEAERFDVLAALIEDYEARVWPALDTDAATP
jgi:hypothetical protein